MEGKTFEARQDPRSKASYWREWHPSATLAWRSHCKHGTKLLCPNWNGECPLPSVLRHDRYCPHLHSAVFEWVYRLPQHSRKIGVLPWHSSSLYWIFLPTIFSSPTWNHPCMTTGDPLTCWNWIEIWVDPALLIVANSAAGKTLRPGSNPNMPSFQDESHLNTAVWSPQYWVEPDTSCCKEMNWVPHASRQ